MADFHIENFGCRAARADGEAIGSELRAAGHAAQPPAEAEVIVVNTCSVTAEADRAARAFIRRAHRHNPQARIVVTGCYAQRAPEELAALEGVAAVVGNSHKALAPQIIQNLFAGEKPLSAPELVQIAPASAPPLKSSLLHEPVAALAAVAPPQTQSLSHGPEAALAAAAPPQVAQAAVAPPQTHSASHEPGAAQAAVAPPQVVVVDERFAYSFLEEEQVLPGAQTRPNLKIQEGCSNRCTFCVIPATRGPSRSLAEAAILKQVEGFVAAGGKELVFSGINLGRWGRDLGAGETLARLVGKILRETELPWLRLSSIEPMDWDEELIGLMRIYGGTRLARHAHLPLQSGSDAVLRRMHRRYRPWHYAEKVQALRKAAGPALTLGADVMAGFPGETEAEFEETLVFLRSLPFGTLHLFPFSPRPGTPGEAMHAAAPLGAEVVTERMARLRALASKKTLAHRRSFLGQELPALTLHTPQKLAAEGRTAALTDNFLPVTLAGSYEANRAVKIRVTALDAAGDLEAVPAEE